LLDQRLAQFVVVVDNQYGSLIGHGSKSPRVCAGERTESAIAFHLT
jgi:hypothetical protein